MHAADADIDGVDIDTLSQPKGTLDDFSKTAANWWIRRLVIDGKKYRDRFHASDSRVEAVRNALAQKIKERILIEQDGHVWLIANIGDEVYPLLERVLREQGLYGAHWRSGPIMWLSYRQGIVRIEIRRPRRRRRPVHNKVIYERFIENEPHQ